MALGRKNKKDAVDQRRSIIAKLFLQGMWQSDIAKHVNVTQQQVSLDIKAIRDKWRKSTIEDYNAKMDQELAKINLLEQEYYDAWNRSKDSFKSRSIKGRQVGEGTEVMERQEKTEDRNGDPRYLQGVQWCIEQRCKIMGIPSKLPTQEIEHKLDMSNLSDEELALLAALKTKVGE